MHKAFDDEAICSVTFSWAKYLVCWSRSGPGYYAGINIEIKGEWPKEIVRCARTR